MSLRGHWTIVCMLDPKLVTTDRTIPVWKVMALIKGRLYCPWFPTVPLETVVSQPAMHFPWYRLKHWPDRILTGYHSFDSLDGAKWWIGTKEADYKVVELAIPQGTRTWIGMPQTHKPDDPLPRVYASERLVLPHPPEVVP